MKCKNCGVELKEGKPFCKECGFENNKDKRQTKKDDNIRRCSVCDSILGEKDAKCKNCGYLREIETEQDEKIVNKYERTSATKRWQIFGVLAMIAMFILGCVIGFVYPTEVIKEYTSISGEYTDEVFNTTLALIYWLSGVAVFIFFQAINSICYRLDLLIDKNN